jgi:hypothetical protein
MSRSSPTILSYIKQVCTLFESLDDILMCSSCFCNIFEYLNDNLLFIVKARTLLERLNGVVARPERLNGVVAQPERLNGVVAQPKRLNGVVAQPVNVQCAHLYTYKVTRLTYTHAHSLTHIHMYMLNM